MTGAEVLDRRTSPDGLLHIRIERYDDGSLAFGFEESDWHQHPDMFDAKGRTPEQVAWAFADDLVNDRSSSSTIAKRIGTRSSIRSSMNWNFRAHMPRSSFDTGAVAG
ncbi:hypothetical protein ASC89_17125 [Devosia sp. Root413D1]|nr:hypothetical protein ASC68_14570 [Devosia sp. Root105]KQW76939.1 hypothetical protein ASC89_17125 [Devosia sp. Root413D1]